MVDWYLNGSGSFVLLCQLIPESKCRVAGTWIDTEQRVGVRHAKHVSLANSVHVSTAQFSDQKRCAQEARNASGETVVLEDRVTSSW